MGRHVASATSSLIRHVLVCPLPHQIQPSAPCRRVVLDVCVSWHAALAAAPELVPTERFTFYLADDYPDDPLPADLQGDDASVRGYIATRTRLKPVLRQLQGLSPHTLSVHLTGFDWFLVSARPPVLPHA